jgi:hypothetical protein
VAAAAAALHPDGEDRRPVPERLPLGRLAAVSVGGAPWACAQRHAVAPDPSVERRARRAPKGQHPTHLQVLQPSKSKQPVICQSSDAHSVLTNAIAGVAPPLSCGIVVTPGWSRRLDGTGWGGSPERGLR